MDYPVTMEPGDSDTFIASQSGGNSEQMTVGVNTILNQLSTEEPDSLVWGWELAGGGESTWLTSFTATKFTDIGVGEEFWISALNAFALYWEVGAAAPDASQSAQWLTAGADIPPTPTPNGQIRSTATNTQLVLFTVLTELLGTTLYEVQFYGSKLAGTRGPRFMYGMIVEVTLEIGLALEPTLARIDAAAPKLKDPTMRAFARALRDRLVADSKLPEAKRRLVGKLKKKKKKAKAADTAPKG